MRHKSDSGQEPNAPNMTRVMSHRYSPSLQGLILVADTWLSEDKGSSCALCTSLPKGTLTTESIIGSCPSQNTTWHFLAVMLEHFLCIIFSGDFSCHHKIVTNKQFKTPFENIQKRWIIGCDKEKMYHLVSSMLFRQIGHSYSNFGIASDQAYDFNKNNLVVVSLGSICVRNNPIYP